LSDVIVLQLKSGRTHAPGGQREEV